MTRGRIIRSLGIRVGDIAPKARMQALGRMKTGQMNKTEAAYAEHLEMRRRAGEIAWFKFEGIKLRLADNAFLTIDFPVMLITGELEMHEVKGHWTDDARVKMKVAADVYPFPFIALTRKGGAWIEERF